MIEYIKSTGVIIVSSDGKLALQLRASHDDSFPAHWDFAAGGGIDEGEDEKKSAEREIKEELGIDATVEFVVRKHYTYEAWKKDTTREADLWIYKTYSNGPFKPDLNEVEKVEFFEIDEIKKMIESGAKIHPEFLLTWNDGIVFDVIK